MTKRMTVGCLFFMLAGFVIFANGTADTSQKITAAFPEGDTLTIIVPVAAGGGMDVKSRLFAKYLAQELGKNVVIDNVPGGATVIACSTYLSEAKDSDSIINLSTDHLVISPEIQHAKYTYKDFIPLIALTYSEEFFWVRTDSPLKTWSDVIVESKKQPVVFGTGAKNGPTYIVSKIASGVSGVTMENVVANSIPASIANMLGGHVDVVWSSYETAREYYLAGKIRPIVGTGKELFKGENNELDVPTLQSLNYDFTFSSCNTLAIRADTDPAKVEIIKNALQKVYRNPEFQAAWEKAGLTVLPDSSAEFAEAAVKQKIALLPRIQSIFSVIGN